MQVWGALDTFLVADPRDIASFSVAACKEKGTSVEEFKQKIQSQHLPDTKLTAISLNGTLAVCTSRFLFIYRAEDVLGQVSCSSLFRTGPLDIDWHQPPLPLCSCVTDTPAPETLSLCADDRRIILQSK